MRAWPSQFLRSLKSDEAQPLQVRLFRLFCLTAAGLCLGVILPLNFFQHLHWGVHVANFTLGLSAAWAYRASLQGRHYFIGFFSVMLLLVNPAWFLTAGSDGSVSYYFFPILVYPLAIFRGRTRWIVAVALILDLCGLLLLNYYFPALRTPFQGPGDRVLDLVAGAGCSMLGLGAVIWVIVSAHEARRTAAQSPDMPRSSLRGRRNIARYLTAPARRFLFMRRTDGWWT